MPRNFGSSLRAVKLKHLTHKLSAEELESYKLETLNPFGPIAQLVGNFKSKNLNLHFWGICYRVQEFGPHADGTIGSSVVESP